MPLAKPDVGTHTAFFTTMSGFKDRMCACKDKACVEKVVDDMNAFSNAQATSQTPLASKPDEQDTLMTVSKQLQDCELKLLGATP